MKISITGHTKGIGKYLYESFLNKKFETIGFSYSTGFDISKKNDRIRILEESKNCDVFINCAYNYKNWDNSQLDMLKEIYDIWENKPNKHIINISSAASYMYPFKGTLEGVPKYDEYVKAKWEQDKWCLSKRNVLNNNSKVNLSNIRPGRILVEKFQKKWNTSMALSLEEFFKVVNFILENPKIEFSSLTLHRN